MEKRDTSGLTPDEGRRFGFSVGAAFLILGGVLFWRGHETASLVAGASGLALFLGGLAVPDRLEPVERAWMGFAHAISKVTNPILMGVIYFLVLMPAGLLARAFGHRPLEHEDDDGTYWVTRESPTGNLDDQF